MVYLASVPCESACMLQRMLHSTEVCSTGESYCCHRVGTPLAHTSGLMKAMRTCIFAIMPVVWVTSWACARMPARTTGNDRASRDKAGSSELMKHKPENVSQPDAYMQFAKCCDEL